MDVKNVISLISELKTKVGLTDTQAEQVSGCIKNYLTDKVPAFMVDYLDDIIAGKKIDFTDIVKDKAESTWDQVSDKADKIGDKVEDVVEDTLAKVGSLFGKK